MDPDREGEAIAWHLAGVGSSLSARGFPSYYCKRQEAPEAPRSIDQIWSMRSRLGAFLIALLAGPCRRRTTAGLNDKQARSAGRVQSAVLRLVVEREEAIAAHDSVQFHQLLAEVSAASPSEDLPSNGVTSQRRLVQ